MRNNRILFLGALLAGTLMVSSCNDYLDINENPNQAVVSTPEYTLATALNASAGRLNLKEIGAFWAGQWSPSGSVSGFVPEKTYDITTNFRTANWNNIYDNLIDYKYVEAEARKQKKRALIGMALTMKAVEFQQLVDTYGNVPFSDALKGTDVIRPKYDNASDIYDALEVILDSARMHLAVPVSGTNPSPGASDLFFAGDVASWLKFANTVKLRILLRQSGVAAKQAHIAAAIMEMGNTPATYVTADVLSSPGYVKSSGKMNQFYENYGFTAGDAKAGNHDFYCYQAFFIDQLILSNDSRLPRLAYLPTNTAFPTYRGVPLGEGSDEYLYTKISGFGPAFIPPTGNATTAAALVTRKMPVMLLAESKFLQAEAIQRGYMTGSAVTAQQHYEGAIQASYNYLGVVDGPDVDTDNDEALDYYSQAINNVSFVTSSNKIEAIITQKWISLAGVNGLEAWAEFRRTGFPNVPLSTRAGSNPHPVRLLYPLSEYSTNGTNVEAEGTINQFTSKIFWDVN